jgi:hypothetical protein
MIKALHNALARLLPGRKPLTPPTVTVSAALQQPEDDSAMPLPTFPSQVRAVHFFGDHDPFSFWTDQDLRRLPDLFTQVIADGFNSVILVVPLFPFLRDPGMAGTRVDGWYLRRLDTVLQYADQAQLSVILRVGYPHSSVPQAFHQSSERVLTLARDPQARAGFATYCREIAAIVRRHRSFVDAFLCWEDVWTLFAEVPNYPEASRRQFAEQVGFALDGQAIVPNHGTPQMAAWIEFFDDFYQRVLGDAARAAFGRIGFEVRTDRYPLPDGQGGYTWLPFNSRSASADVARYGYWAPYFGQRNEGEYLDAATATKSLAYTLEALGPPNNAIIEQFNFLDNTLAYIGSHARIDREALPAFLAQAAQVIAERARGYGLWVYRDYRENMLYNCRFERGLEDWQSDGALQRDGLRLVAGQSLTKTVVPATRAQGPHARYGEFLFSVVAACDTPAQAEVFIDDRPVTTLTLAQGQTLATIARADLGWDGMTLTLKLVTGTAVIARLQLFGFTQQGGIYDADNQAGPHRDLIRTFNQQLANAHASSKRPAR